MKNQRPRYFHEAKYKQVKKNRIRYFRKGKYEYTQVIKIANTLLS